MPITDEMILSAPNHIERSRLMLRQKYEQTSKEDLIEFLMNTGDTWELGYQSGMTVGFKAGLEFAASEKESSRDAL